MARLEGLLAGHLTADPSKTMAEVMSASEIKQLQKGLTEAAEAWVAALRAVRQAAADAASLGTLDRPAA